MQLAELHENQQPLIPLPPPKALPPQDSKHMPDRPPAIVRKRNAFYGGRLTPVSP
jgi:hypothetical protein